MQLNLQKKNTYKLNSVTCFHTLNEIKMDQQLHIERKRYLFQKKKERDISH